MTPGGPLGVGMPRWAAFAAVAALGFGVQLAVILLLASAGLHPAAATAAGVTVAWIHNVAWHERWTWTERRQPGGLMGRLLRLSVTTAVVSLTGTVLLTAVYVSALQAPLALANLMAVCSVGAINYVLLDRVVYRVMP